MLQNSDINPFYSRQENNESEVCRETRVCVLFLLAGEDDF